jgi:predicted ATPase/signal transduction histidine kinase
MVVLREAPAYMAGKNQLANEDSLIYRGDTVIFETDIPVFGGHVVLKKPAHSRLSSAEFDALDNEYRISRRLASGNVRRVLGKATTEHGPALILQFIEGKPLRQYLIDGPQDFPHRFRLAVDVAAAVHDLHKQHVVHNDLTSANIMIGSPENTVHIIDLGSAIWRDGGTIKQASSLIKRDSLPYLSPERIANPELPFDYRADTYSLGVLLYEILTGRLPFQAKDPKELFHEHAARSPTPPRLLNPGIPHVLEGIILKLLAKDPAKRYQSAFGLLSDLKRCFDQSTQNQEIAPFPLGAMDRSSFLKIPERQYGREKQIKKLRTLIEGAGGTGPKLVLVSGYAGIGKTVLVERMREPTLSGGGLFLRGKAEQYRSNIPYTVFATAFQELVTFILSKSDEEVLQWRSAITEALGDQSLALADVVPGIGRILIPGKDVYFLGGREAQNRLTYLMRAFLRVLTQLISPLVLFLDDLQWIDTASLDLLRALFVINDLVGLYVIGAYRDNEVDEKHPLSAFLADMENRRADMTRIVLDNLDVRNLSTMFADTFGPNPWIDDMSELLFRKTMGNPFFTKQLLYSLNETEQIRFNVESQRWEWEIESLQALDISENVVEYLVSTINSLGPRTQDLLKMAAAIGVRFDPSLLGKLRGETAADVIRELQIPEAMQLLRQEERGYRFVHDRIHQAVYGSTDNSSKRLFHLAIGRMLLQDLPEEQRESLLFEIVDHLNIGVSIVCDRDERNRIAQLNLKAARKARDSAAFTAMLQYVEQGIGLLDPDTWHASYDLSLELYTMAAEAEYLHTNFEAAQDRARIIFDNARATVDEILAYEIVMMCCFARYRMDEAISMGKKVLSMLGVDLATSAPDEEDVNQYRRLPRMTDPKSLAAMRILTLMFAPAMVAEPHLLPTIVFTLMELCSSKGNSSYSAFGYALYGMYLCENPDNIDRGTRFGALAVEVLESSDRNRLEHRVRELVQVFIASWGEKHLREVTEEMNRIAKSAMEAGEVEIACNQFMSLCILLPCIGEPLETVIETSSKHLNSLSEMKQGFQLKMAQIWAQLQINLNGKAENPHLLTGRYVDESRLIDQIEYEHDHIRYYTYLAIAILNYFTGDYEKSLKYTEMSSESRPRMFGFAIAETHALYYALAILRLYAGFSKGKQKQYLKNLEPIRRRKESLAHQGSINFGQDHYLIEAEVARVQGDTERALRLYEKAIGISRKNRYPNFEAISCELAGRFCLEQELEGPAHYYLNRAYDLFQQWGLMLKVWEMERSYADLLEERIPTLEDVQFGNVPTLISGRPDLESGLKAIRTLSSETELKTLLNRMMGIVMEHAGSERGVLLLKHDNRWYIQATGDFQQKRYEILLKLPFTEESSKREDCPLPSSIVNLCLHSEESLVIDNALSDARFSSDPYIIRNRVRSALCVPLRYQGRLNGALYLENRQTARLFEHIRVEMFELLCTQFSISFENALLYEALQERLRFEQLFAELSATFVNLPVSKIGRQFSLWLRNLADFLETDRGAVYECSGDCRRLVLKQFFAGPHIPKPPSSMTRLPWLARRIATGSTVIFRNIDELPTKATKERRYCKEHGIRSYIAVPMSVGGTMLGVLEFTTFHRENSWGDQVADRLRLIEEIFAQALKRRISEKTLQRRTVELKKNAVKLKKLTEHLQEVREHERANIAREIHDELGQVLTILRMDTSWLGRHIQDDPAVLATRLQEMIGLIDSATDSVQNIARELRPQMLDLLGLFDAIEWQASEFQRREGITCRTVFRGKEIEEENTVIVLFRIVQEALTNVARHANAGEVTVRLEVDKGCILLEVVDDGRGITEEQVFGNRSLGLIGMRERVSFLNGKMEITGKKGQGTHLLVTLPVEWKT